MLSLVGPIYVPCQLDEKRGIPDKLGEESPL